ncbi:MAG: hypothetical protein F4Y80_01665 [Caldilineaceae bacterium SB0665_bin_21]|nr:hypothetical protein [Caldilineaceae bacterium SB0665_bin_21]
MPMSLYRTRRKFFRLPADHGGSWYIARAGLLSVALAFACALIPGQSLARDTASQPPAQTRDAGQAESDVPPVTASGPYDNLAVNPGGTFRLTHRHPIVTALFRVDRSPVQYLARQQPEPLFFIPEGFRPALELEWEVEGRPVRADGTPAPDDAPPRTFTLRVATDGSVRYVDNARVDGVGHLGYEVRLAWPLAGAEPDVCERTGDMRRTLESIVSAAAGEQVYCANITWEQLATVRSLLHYNRQGYPHYVRFRDLPDLAGLQGVTSAALENLGEWPPATLAPIPAVETLYISSGSMPMGGPSAGTLFGLLPADLLAYTPLVSDLRVQAVSFANFADDILASVPRLRILHLDNRLKGLARLEWPTDLDLSAFLQSVSELTELRIDLGGRTDLPADFLSPVPGLRTLMINASRVSTIPGDLLAPVPHLEMFELDLREDLHFEHWRGEDHFSDGFLASLPALQTLKVHANLAELPADFLGHAPRLSVVDLHLGVLEKASMQRMHDVLFSLNPRWFWDPSFPVPGSVPVVGRIDVLATGTDGVCRGIAQSVGALADTLCVYLSGKTFFAGRNLSSVASGSGHSCAVTADARLSCWEHESFDELPVPAGRFTSVSVGAHQTCSVRYGGNLACWRLHPHRPAPAPTGSFLSVAVGERHACGLTLGLTLRCWGDNDLGQTDAPAGRFRAVVAGGHFSCALRAVGNTVRCWGDGRQGQTSVPWGLRTWAAGARIGRTGVLATGHNHACAINHDARMVCWGGDGKAQASMPEGEYYRVAAGFRNTCGVGPEGTVRCWEWSRGEPAGPPPQR